MPTTLRHEYKFFITPGDDLALTILLDRLLKRDENGDEWGVYPIRSLYFDDAYDRAYFDKLDGVRDRDKYRLRVYHYSDKVIRLERKSKRGDYIEKTSIEVTRDEADRLIACDVTGLENHPKPLMREMYRLMRTKLLRPAVIVDYDRQAFLHPAENTRITLDRQLRTGLYCLDFFNFSIPTMPPLRPGESILEVKFDKYLPDYLRPVLASIRANRSAISKYVHSRTPQF